MEIGSAYHNQQLANQRRNLAATVIQRHVRGWVVRMRIANMKRQSLLALGRTWPRVTRDYRELVTRTQARHGVMRTSCPFKLSEMEDYLHKREKYERVFERVATGDKLSRDQLKEFIEACGHYPTEGEITAAFNAVFRGSGATAELVFVLDCSTSLGIVGFHDQMTFVKDVVRTLDVGPDRVRVGVVPYNTDVFHVFGLLQHTNKQEVIEAVDKIRFRPGLTHTGIALAMMRDVFKDARPGVQKVAVVVTDGQSHDRRQTALEAKKAADANITVFAIGVGNNVEHAELEEIAGDAGRLYMCSNYHTLQTLKHLINSKLCLQLYGLYKAEALDILFTLFVLPATGLLPPTPSLAPAAMRLDHASKGMLVPPPPSSSSCLVFDEDNKIIRATDFKVCLGLVVKSKLERDGVISIPSDVRSGVEEATTYDEAMEKIDQYIEKRRREGRPLPVPTD
nr:hypothetical protein BaRGS_013165 [Batillaria attramentaria]